MATGNSVRVEQWPSACTYLRSRAIGSTDASVDRNPSDKRSEIALPSRILRLGTSQSSPARRISAPPPTIFPRPLHFSLPSLTALPIFEPPEKGRPNNKSLPSAIATHGVISPSEYCFRQFHVVLFFIALIRSPDVFFARQPRITLRSPLRPPRPSDLRTITDHIRLTFSGYSKYRRIVRKTVPNVPRNVVVFRNSNATREKRYENDRFGRYRLNTVG